MKENLKKYFGVWWKPMLTFIIVIGIYFFGLMAEIKLIYDTFEWLILILILLILVSVVYQFINRKWYFGLLQIVLTFGILFFFSFFLMYYPNDFFADNLKIPNDIEFQKPIELDTYINPKAKDSLVKADNSNLSFELANFFQPGIYEYYFWYNPTELGFIYLKAIEITQNQELSVERLRNNSVIEITELNNKVNLYTKEFTIYEGDWGKPYGSRIELWFKPKEGKSEFKLTEKNYIIEGWMR